MSHDTAPAMHAPTRQPDPTGTAPTTQSAPGPTTGKPQNAHYACKVPASVTAATADAALADDGATSQAVTPARHAKAAVPDAHIRIAEHGPYAVDASVPLYEDALTHDDDRQCMVYRRVRTVDTAGHQRDGSYHLCRCGQSKDKPFCDGSHVQAGFDGSEVADRMPYTARADLYQGKGVDLLDDGRCAFARLCHRHDQDVWTLTQESGDPHRKQLAVEAAWECPTGRLTSYDAQTRQPYEEHWEPSVTILEDIQEHAAGPLFVRGGVGLTGADGRAYEARNRYALCRCGHSQNAPFCDAMHIPQKFLDDSPAWSGDLGEPDTDLNRTPKTQ